MRAIVMTAFGGPEVLRLTDIPEPEPEHGQIRVRLYAAGSILPKPISERPVCLLQTHIALYPRV